MVLMGKTKCDPIDRSKRIKKGLGLDLSSIAFGITTVPPSPILIELKV